MSTGEIRVDDVGTWYTITVYKDGSIADLVDATEILIGFLLPDGETLIKTASPVGDGSDGLVRVVFIVDELSVSGDWKWQARITSGSGVWKSDRQTLPVEGNLPITFS